MQIRRAMAVGLGVLTGALVGCGSGDESAGSDSAAEGKRATNPDTDDAVTTSGEADEPSDFNSMGADGASEDGLVSEASPQQIAAGPAALPPSGTASPLPAGVPPPSGAGGGPSIADSAGTADPSAPIANTNVSLGGSQDFGYFRQQLDAGLVPEPGTFDAAGFFAEHHTKLPVPDCGNRVCLQAMVGVMGNLLNGQNCTMLQLGLNSPIAADANQRPPLSLAVVVDTSGSMNTDGQIGFVRQGLDLLIDGLKDEDRFALITYSTNSQTVFPMSDVAENRVEIRELVRNLTAEGSTNLYDGLEDGYREVFANYDSGRQNRVILLSDGNPTVGVTDNDSIGKMSEGYNSDGVGLTTIGLGTSFNYDLMRNLALKADGNFYFLESAGAVSEVFDEELSFFTVPIAFDLSLEVRAGSEYEFGRAVGSPLWENTDDGGSLKVPSVFIAHRESDKDVTDEGGRRGGGSALLLELMPRLRPASEMVAEDGGTQSADIAVVDVSFREPGTDEQVQDTVVINYPNAPWETPETGYFANANSDSNDVTVVTKSFVMLNVFVGLEQAVAAYHENSMDPSQSIAELTALLAALDDYNEEVQDTDIEFDIDLVEQLIDVMIDNSVPAPNDDLIDIPDDPWPAD